MFAATVHRFDASFRRREQSFGSTLATVSGGGTAPQCNREPLPLTLPPPQQPPLLLPRAEPPSVLTVTWAE